MINKISKCFFINLDKRKDRLDHINNNLPFKAKRFPAIDANDLHLNYEIRKLFRKCLNKLTKAEIACSLSHYKLWKQLTLDTTAENYLILEDDVVFKDGFVSFWNQAFSKEMPADYNLIYLGGCQPWNKPQYHKALKSYNKYFCNVKKNDFFTKNDHYFHMNAQSYIISKRGANLICQYVDQLGFDLEKSQAQDVFMINFFNSNKLFKMPHTIFHLNPSMTYQLHEENDNIEIDKNSDLRFATEKFKETKSSNKPIQSKYKIIWQVNPDNNKETYESDWLRELFSNIDYEEIVDCNYSVLQDNSIIIYSDIWHHTKNDARQETLYNYLDEASKHHNVSIIHLGDEYTQARTDHYKNFKLAIRTTYNHSVRDIKNLIQIPLGYKQGFHD